MATTTGEQDHNHTIRAGGIRPGAGHAAQAGGRRPIPAKLRVSAR
jgi:hypothetical protein